MNEVLLDMHAAGMALQVKPPITHLAFARGL
jgi:hypothetical protein